MLVKVMVYGEFVVVIGLERLPVDSDTSVPVEVILLTPAVITVPGPVLDDEEKYTMNVRGPVKVTFPATAGWE